MTSLGCYRRVRHDVKRTSSCTQRWTLSVINWRPTTTLAIVDIQLWTRSSREKYPYFWRYTNSLPKQCRISQGKPLCQQRVWSVQPFGYSTGFWLTDGQTDKHRAITNNVPAQHQAGKKYLTSSIGNTFWHFVGWLEFTVLWTDRRASNVTIYHTNL